MHAETWVAGFPQGLTEKMQSIVQEVVGDIAIMSSPSDEAFRGQVALCRDVLLHNAHPMFHSGTGVNRCEVCTAIL